MFHQRETEGKLVICESCRERRKSAIMDFWVGENLPYHRTVTGRFPSSKTPLWYVKAIGGGWYSEVSFLVAIDKFVNVKRRKIMRRQKVDEPAIFSKQILKKENVENVFVFGI